MTARPLVTVFSGNEKSGDIKLPAVFSSPIRIDVVQFVHTNMAKNNRQPYAVSSVAGEQTSAESWGTGRAVSRIPRVGGGGTSRSGQGAFGNMCRGGRMFNPTKTWRKWHRKINVNQRRYAVCSAVAASALPGLVQARGHRIHEVPEVPLVLNTDSVSKISTTKEAVALLKTVGAYPDVQRVKDSRNLRAGRGKMRNRRYTQRRGPLVVFKKSSPLLKALRNVPGVEFAKVNQLNLLQLAPGGHLGRFIIWTSDAFESLDDIFGTDKVASKQKNGFKLPQAKMTHADLHRIINSDEIQSVIRARQQPKRKARIHRNPLKNMDYMLRLNPYAATQKRQNILAQEKNKKARAAGVQKKRQSVRNPKFAALLTSD